VLLVGDAADFYDPFTGEGVYAALRGAELAADHAAEALRRNRLGPAHLAAYDRGRRKAFAAKWTLERIVSWVVSRPWALGHVADRLRRRPEMADLLVSVTAHVAPPSSVFRPSYARRLVA
jgi:flavin-dependent dehydrogenase